MAFPTQFSLSLELTRLMPLALQAAGQTYKAAMKLARDLQNSGSDIVVEEDMAEAFRRSRITDNVASSFRTTMSMSDPPLELGAGLAMFRGPGPTVARALVEPAYFSTVVQLIAGLSVRKMVLGRMFIGAFRGADWGDARL